MNAFFHMHNASYNILNGYGMTETGSSVCTNMQNRSMAGSIGIPLPYMTLAVFDENVMNSHMGSRVNFASKAQVL